ncbi:M13 family metallopeptidase [Levilactobacillus bambusae]|nr:M13-type metalloendopeptidase [Levilactobacillus bambusae]
MKQYPVETAKIKDDLYDAVNDAWLSQAEIPADHSQTGGFVELMDEIEKTLMHDFDELRDGKAQPDSSEMAEFTKFYQLTSDFNQREADGTKPLQPILDRITALNSLADLNAQLSDWILSDLPLPVSLSVEADMKHTETYALYANAPSLFMPDKTYYDEGNRAAETLMSAFTTAAVGLLEQVGYTKADAEKITALAKEYDRAIAPNVKSAEESADYAKNYNPEQFADFLQFVPALDLKSAVHTLVDGDPDTIIVTEPVFYQSVNQLLTTISFDQIKAWMLVKVLFNYSNLMNDEFRQTAGTYSRTLSGQKELRSVEKAAYYQAKAAFSQVTGLYYGQKYFGEKAKVDVQNMVKAMIAVYQNRLKTNTWLSKETREKAVTKLSKLEIQVGYPDKLDPMYSQLHVTPASEGGTVLSNLDQFSRQWTEYHFSKWNKPTDRTRWEMSADTVNAYYEPLHNIIVFPAAILQAPFYSLDQSSSQNYGGIGAVIAHEISHAFDNNGAKFDEYGNLHNWWTAEDLDHFDALAQKMIAEFDGLPFAGGHVNGKLTVSENIADAGGLSCALEAAKGEPDVDLAAFFINWATIWRTKATKQIEQLLLNIDVHAPAKLRADVQVKNLDDFYSTFGVVTGDPMYLAPDKRVHIW